MKDSYDVVIVGGAVIGSAVAYFLSVHPDFRGSVLVVERDPTYRFASTSLSSSSIRTQFSNPVNVKINQFGSEPRYHEFEDIILPALAERSLI